MGQTVYHVSTNEIPIILTGEGEPHHLHLPYTQVELGDKSKITQAAGARFQSSLHLSAPTVYMVAPSTDPHPRLSLLTGRPRTSNEVWTCHLLSPDGPSLIFNATCSLCHQCPKNTFLSSRVLDSSQKANQAIQTQRKKVAGYLQPFCALPHICKKAST